MKNEENFLITPKTVSQALKVRERSPPPVWKTGGLAIKHREILKILPVLRSQALLNRRVLIHPQNIETIGKVNLTKAGVMPRPRSTMD